MQKRSSLTRRIIWAIIGCSLFLFVLKSSEWQTKIASSIAYPFICAQHWVSDIKKRRMAVGESHETVLKRLSALTAERDTLLRQLIEKEATSRYEADSCEVREFKKRFHLENAHIAQVIMVNRSPAGHYMFVSCGAASGAEPDMVVLANNCLVGRVSEVYLHYSKVLLTTDKNCRVAAICTKTGARGIHEGCNDEKISHLAFVSHFDAVEVGDMVVSHGAGLIFPRGFALGKVKSCVSSGVFHVVEVEPIVDVQKIDFCLLVKRQDVEVVVCAPVQEVGKCLEKTTRPSPSITPLKIDDSPTAVPQTVVAADQPGAVQAPGESAQVPLENGLQGPSDTQVSLDIDQDQVVSPESNLAPATVKNVASDQKGEAPVDSTTHADLSGQE
jgi:rod shape-determining protein MreC